jgi:hypothetical protein
MLWSLSLRANIISRQRHPPVQHCVSNMSNTNEQFASKLGTHILEYLAEAKKFLEWKKSSKATQPTTSLPRRTLDLLKSIDLSIFEKHEIDGFESEEQLYVAFGCRIIRFSYSNFFFFFNGNVE